jgi:hypothetical protein
MACYVQRLVLGVYIVMIFFIPFQSSFTHFRLLKSVFPPIFFVDKSFLAHWAPLPIISLLSSLEYCSYFILLILLVLYCYGLFYSDREG